MTMAGKIPLTKMYAKTSSRSGEVYYVGRLAAARVLLFKAREQPDEGDPVYELLLEAVEGDPPAGRAPRQERQPRSRQRPQKAAAEIEDDPIPNFMA